MVNLGIIGSLSLAWLQSVAFVPSLIVLKGIPLSGGQGK